MNVNFYNTKIKKNELNKTLGTPIVKTCALKNGSSIEDPVLYMEHDVSLFNTNYVYIPDFGRYYFISGRELVEHTEYITCHVDVLKSFADDIKNSKGIATRSQFYNRNLADKMIIPLESEKIRYRILSSPITGGTYVAIIGGK